MRVLGLFPSFGVGEKGGIQESARVAWEALSRASFDTNGEVTLFCFGNGHRDDKYFPADYLLTSKASAIAAALRQRWHPTLVLVWHIGLLKLLPFFRISEARVALFLHGVEVWHPLDWLTHRQLRRVNLILSNSDHTWSKFKSINEPPPNARYLKVPLGIASPLNVSSPSPDHPPIALMLGRLSRNEAYKGHQEVIRAWPFLPEKFAAAKLWIVGDGDLRCELEREAAALGLQDRVKFWGQVPEACKQELLSRCRCLVLPSRGEGFGLVYLEAMRAGRPCLTSIYDAGREVVNPPEAGLAVDPADSIALAEALCRLLADTTEWSTWSRRATMRYAENFTAKHFQDRIVSALFNGTGMVQDV